MVRNEFAKSFELSLGCGNRWQRFIARRSGMTPSRVRRGTQFATLVAAAMPALLLPQAQHAPAAPSEFCN